MNDVEISNALKGFSKRLSAFGTVITVDHSGIALSLNAIASDLQKIAEEILAEDEVYHGFDWIAIRDALAVVRPDLSIQIDRYLKGAVQ